MRLPLKPPCPSPVVAFGADRNSGFCIAENGVAGLHVLGGDLYEPSSLLTYRDKLNQALAGLGTKPVLAVHDSHPDFASTRLALDRGTGRVEVQHHHAHMAAVMAEYDLEKKVIGVVFDGMGLGDNDELWGGEFLVGDRAGFSRAGHLLPVRQPGGDAAAFEPWRMALAWLEAAMGDEWQRGAGPIVAVRDPGVCECVLKAASRGVNSPFTTSAGRLFEAVSSIIGIRHVNTRPALAAVELEGLADLNCREPFSFNVDEKEDVFIGDPRSTIRDIVGAVSSAKSPSFISSAFHNAVAGMIVEVCCRIGDATGISQVILSGGVFQNRFLSHACQGLLEKSGFRVYIPRLVPVHDGGLSYGQAAVAVTRFIAGEI